MKLNFATIIDILARTTEQELYLFLIKYRLLRSGYTEFESFEWLHVLVIFDSVAYYEIQRLPSPSSIW